MQKDLILSNTGQLNIEKLKKSKKSKNLLKNKFIFLLDNSKSSNIIRILIKPLNFEIESSLSFKYSKKFRWSKNRLFYRGANKQFFNFVKLSSLFVKKKISADLYCRVIGDALKYLNKKNHGFFLKFLNAILNSLVLNSDSEVLGVKFVLNGKIKGKTRCKSIKMSKGRLLLTAKKANLSYSKTFIYTKYGVFGLHMWANYELIKRKLALFKSFKRFSKKKQLFRKVKKKRYDEKNFSQIKKSDKSFNKYLKKIK